MKKTRIFTKGTVVEIHHESSVFYCLLEVDFDFFKTFGNTNIDSTDLTFFNEDWEKLDRDDTMCTILTPMVNDVVIHERQSRTVEYIPSR